MTKPITKSRIKVEPDKKKNGFDLIKDGIKKIVSTEEYSKIMEWLENDK